MIYKYQREVYVASAIMRSFLKKLPFIMKYICALQRFAQPIVTESASNFQWTSQLPVHLKPESKHSLNVKAKFQNLRILNVAYELSLQLFQSRESNFEWTSQVAVPLSLPQPIVLQMSRNSPNFPVNATIEQIYSEFWGQCL